MEKTTADFGIKKSEWPEFPPNVQYIVECFERSYSDESQPQNPYDARVNPPTTFWAPKTTKKNLGLLKKYIVLALRVYFIILNILILQFDQKSFENMSKSEVILNLTRPKYLKNALQHYEARQFKVQTIRHVFETLFRLLWLLSDKNFIADHHCSRKLNRYYKIHFYLTFQNHCPQSR